MNRSRRDFEEMLEGSFGCSETVPLQEVDLAWTRLVRDFHGKAGIGREVMFSSELIHRKANWMTLPRHSLGLAAVTAVCAILSIIAVRNFLANRNVQAFVETSVIGLQREVAGKAEDVFAGQRLGFGEVIHSNNRSGSVLILNDKSRIELRSNSQLALEAADDGVRVQLYTGSVIVTAAKLRTGHLYVRTRDLTASVVGTVFVVNAEPAGSRVAVLEGEVHVKQGVTDSELLSGQQIATNQLMEPRPINQEVSWSPHAEMHLALLQKVSPTEAPVKKLDFEAASIKPEPPTRVGDGTVYVPLRCAGADGILELLDPAQADLRDVFGDRRSVVPRGRCVGSSTLADLIGLAYGIKDTALLRRSLMGGDEWMYRTPDGSFQIDAKAEEPAAVTKSQLQQMLQNLLAERFKLKVSWQSKELQGFVMYTANDGAKLLAASGEEGLRLITQNVGNAQQRVITGNASLEAFLDFISIRPPLRSGPGDRINTILDRTNLKERVYFFNLSYAVPPIAPSSGDGRRGGGAGYVEGFAPAFPNMRDALQKQLGLRLEPTKMPVDYIEIEYAEKPTAN